MIYTIHVFTMLCCCANSNTFELKLSETILLRCTLIMHAYSCHRTPYSAPYFSLSHQCFKKEKAQVQMCRICSEQH